MYLYSDLYHKVILHLTLHLVFDDLSLQFSLLPVINYVRPAVRHQMNVRTQ